MGAVAAVTTVAGACGGAAFAACRITARKSPMIETIGKNKIIHRIFMNKPLSLRDGIIPQAVERRHLAEADEQLYGATPLEVPADHTFVDAGLSAGLNNSLTTCGLSRRNQRLEAYHVSRHTRSLARH